MKIRKDDRSTMCLALVAALLLAAGCDDAPGSEDDAKVLDEEHGDDEVDVVDSSEGEGVRPEDADVYSDDDYLVSTVDVTAENGGVYTYEFFATPDGDSAVIVKGGVELPQPLDGDDVCPLHTFLKVAPEDHSVPPELLASCLGELHKFGDGIESREAEEEILVGDLRNASTGGVAYELGFRSHYCSGGDGGRSAFEDQRCDDIDGRVANTYGPGLGAGLCSIHSMLDQTSSCSQGPLQAQRRARCDSHVTGGWLQLTGSISIFPDGCVTNNTTKTRWQVAACVQPLEIKWKKRSSSSASFPSAWNHFTNVNPNYWATLTLYAGTSSTGYLCTSGDCWRNEDYRVAIDQDPGDGRFRVANGWATMQGSASSSSCTLAL